MLLLHCQRNNNRKIIFNDKTDKITKSAVEVINKRSNLEKGDILFSGIGTIGKVALVDIKTDNWNCSESVYLLKPNISKVMPKYLLYYFRCQNFQNLLNNTSIGSTLKGVRKEVLLNIKIVVPPLSRQREIVEILDKFDTLVNNISKGLPREIELRKSSMSIIGRGY